MRKSGGARRPDFELSREITPEFLAELHWSGVQSSKLDFLPRGRLKRFTLRCSHFAQFVRWNMTAVRAFLIEIFAPAGKVPWRRYKAIRLPPSSTTAMTPPEHGSAGIRFGGSDDFLCPFERQNFPFSHLSAC